MYKLSIKSFQLIRKITKLFFLFFCKKCWVMDNSFLAKYHSFSHFIFIGFSSWKLQDCKSRLCKQIFKETYWVKIGQNVQCVVFASCLVTFPSHSKLLFDKKSSVKYFLPIYSSFTVTFIFPSQLHHIYHCIFLFFLVGEKGMFTV